MALSPPLKAFSHRTTTTLASHHIIWNSISNKNSMYKWGKLGFYFENIYWLTGARAQSFISFKPDDLENKTRESKISFSILPMRIKIYRSIYRKCNQCKKKKKKLNRDTYTIPGKEREWSMAPWNDRCSCHGIVSIDNCFENED